MTRNLTGLILFAALLSAQPAAPQKPGKVDGVVVNSVTGDPVKKASVALQLIRQDPTRTTITDSAGRFHFDDVAPGNYRAIATRDGFIPPHESRYGPFGSKPFTVAEEQQVKQLVLKLIPLAVVSGHVFDEDGDPIARAQVQALRYIYRPRDVRQLNPHPRCKTDEAIRKMAARGGVMGITGVRMFVSGAEPTTIENVLDHYDHVAKLVGVEHLGVGSDIGLDGYDALPAVVHDKLRASYNGKYGFRAKDDIEGLDHSQRTFDLAEGLIRRGYSDANIEQILGGNFKRVLAEIWSSLSPR